MDFGILKRHKKLLRKYFRRSSKPHFDKVSEKILQKLDCSDQIDSRLQSAFSGMPFCGTNLVAVFCDEL